MVPGLHDVELAGKPVYYNGQWYQPYYGPACFVEFYLLTDDSDEL